MTRRPDPAGPVVAAVLLLMVLTVIGCAWTATH